MKRLFLLVLLFSLGLIASMPATSQAEDKPEPPNCSSSISGLILNPGCNSPELNENNKKLICGYKNKDYLIGEVYMKASIISGDMYFIKLENGRTFSINKIQVYDRSVEVGDPVLVIKQSGDYYVEKFKPKWIASLPGINLSDRKINSIISRYLKNGETIDAFCEKKPGNEG